MLSAHPAAAAPDLRFSVKSWGTEEGLPQNSIIAMTQSRDGYLWLGTQNGLVRFDGTRFTVFDENNTPGLENSRIVRIFEDSRTNLWVGTESAGVALVKDGKVKSLDLGRGSRSGRLMSACEDATGAVWLYTADGQLARFHNGAADVWNAGGRNISNCRAVIAENSGPVWAGMDTSLSGMDPAAVASGRPLPALHETPMRKLDALVASSRGGHWRLADGRVQHWTTNSLDRDLGAYPWTNALFSTACEDRDGNLVVGTLGEGVFWFDAAGVASRISMKEGLSHNYILSLTADHEGNLWVGTDGGGLDCVKRQVFHAVEELRGPTIQSICDDGSGGVWLGINGGGIAHLTNGLVQRFGAEQGLPDLFVRSVFVDKQRRVWVGTYRGGLYEFADGRFRQAPGFDIINIEISAVHEDRAGNLWLGTQRGLVRRNGRDWVSSDVVRALADDAEGNLWIGTEGAGLARLRDGKSASFRKSAGGLPSDNITALVADNDGSLWVGTGSGLARLRDGAWSRFTKGDGLASSSINFLLDGGDGFLWIGSNAGLMRVAKKSLDDFAGGRSRSITCRTYGRADGLPTGECSSGSQPAACRAKDGLLWFPTIQGAASLDPAQLRANTNPPPVLIESALVEGRGQNNAGSLGAARPHTVTLPAGKSRLDIQFTSLNLASADKALIRYRLEGHDADWLEADKSRSAHYNRLAPGRYEFRVTACNEDNFCNDAGATLTVIVEPPFWRTWWFLVSAALALLAAVAGVVHYFSTQKLQRQLAQLRQQEAVEKERARIARDIHDQVGANLTQVSLLGELIESDKDSPDDVAAHARQISEAALETTHALDEIVWTVNPSNDTLESLVSYICKHGHEYLGVAGLKCRLDLPADLPATMVSPEIRHNVFLVVKEALNNVVKHARAASVQIRLRLEPEKFAFEIEDDGCGPAGAENKPDRNGLRNMRKRMEDVGGAFAIGPAAGRGTLIRLTAPLAKN